MLDLYLLEYLVAFRDAQTVEGAAEALHVTAPTVSRGLKKLEAELGTALLDRTPVKIELNATGAFAAEHAAALLQRAQDFQSSVIAFAQEHERIRCAEVVPGPLEALEALGEGAAGPKLERLPGFATEEDAARLLLTGKADLAITSEEHEGDELESVFVGRDALIAKFTDINELHAKDAVTFADLAGHEFVLPRDIGLWKNRLDEHAADAMLIYQDNATVFGELVKYSNFPLFRTRLTDDSADEGFRARKAVPATGEGAQMDLYATYRAQDRAKLRPVAKALSEAIERKAGRSGMRRTSAGQTSNSGARPA